MRSRLAAAAVVVLSVAVLLVSQAGRAGQRAPTMSLPVKEVLAKMKKNPKTPKSDVATVRFYAEVFDGKTIELVMGDLANAGFTGQHITDAVRATNCGPLKEPQLKAATALAAEYGDALPGYLRGYTLGQQGKAEEAGKLLMPVLEEMQPLDRCVAFHPDDAGRHANRFVTWSQCLQKLVPQHDAKKLEALEKKVMACQLESAGVVG